MPDLIRILLARLLLRFGCWVLDRADGLLSACLTPARGQPAPAPYRPLDRMLLGSIVGLGICTLWIWFSVRAAP